MRDRSRNGCSIGIVLIKFNRNYIAPDGGGATIGSKWWQKAAKTIGHGKYLHLRGCVADTIGSGERESVAAQMA